MEPNTVKTEAAETFEQARDRGRAEERAYSVACVGAIEQIVKLLPGAWVIDKRPDSITGIVWSIIAARPQDGFAVSFYFPHHYRKPGRIEASYKPPRNPNGNEVIYFYTDRPRPACTFAVGRPPQTVARQIVCEIITPGEAIHKIALANLEADRVQRALGYALYVAACEAQGETPVPEAEAFKKYGCDVEHVGEWRIEQKGSAKLEHGLIVSDPVKLRKIIKALAEIAAGRRKPEPETEKEEG